MENIQIGIGRVSTKDQNPQRQIEAFRALGIEDRYIFIDKVTGKKGNILNRDEYIKARTIARKGDEIYLDALDRLGRNTQEIEQEWRYFTEEVGCYMIVMDMPLLDTRPKEGMNDGISDLVAKIALSIFAYLAQRDYETRRRVQRDGIEIAKKEGKYKGRKPVEVDQAEFARLYAEVKAGERTNKSVMDRMSLKSTTYYKLVREFEEKTGRFAKNP